MDKIIWNVRNTSTHIYLERFRYENGKCVSFDLVRSYWKIKKCEASFLMTKHIPTKERALYEALKSGHMCRYN